MKTYGTFTALFLLGCSCLISSGSGDLATAEISSTEFLSTESTIEDFNATFDANKTTDKAQGPKSKIKNIVTKIKNKLKEGLGGGSGHSGSGYWRHRYGHKRKTNGSSNYDTSTVLWIAFGTIGGSVLLIVVYYIFRAYYSTDKQADAY